MSRLFAGVADAGAALEEARAAGRSGDWAACLQRFEVLAAASAASGEALAGLAVARRLNGDEVGACEALERAFGAFLDAGDVVQAARAATVLCGQRQNLGEVAASSGWEQRALRLLDRIGPCPERGYLALARTGCEYHDPDELIERAAVAADTAERFDDRELAIRALGDRGLALVCKGEVDAGFALLDEMMVAVAAGEVGDPETNAKAVCAMLTACERTGDAGRSEYWLRRIEETPLLRVVGIIDTHCQIVYGTLEGLRGRWDAAEERLTTAMRLPMQTSHHTADSRSRLAALRIQKGALDEAERLLDGFEDKVEVAPVLARLHLARGRPHDAAVLLRTAARALRNDTMRVAPVLALLVEVELLCGDAAAAEKAADRLAALEEACSSNEIRAMARLALSRIAGSRGDHERALEELDTSLALLTHLDRPLLTAHVRLELARAHSRLDATATARAEAAAARGLFDRLGLAGDRLAAQRLIDELGDGVSRRRPPASRERTLETLTPRETEVAELVCAGMSNREIAERLKLSVRTVETHVDRVLGKLGFHTRTQLAASYRAATS